CGSHHLRENERGGVVAGRSAGGPRGDRSCRSALEASRQDEVGGGCCLRIGTLSRGSGRWRVRSRRLLHRRGRLGGDDCGTRECRKGGGQDLITHAFLLLRCL